MSAIQIADLSKSFPRKGHPPTVAVDRLSFTIPEGQIFGILGPNGAGKTTTIKMICGLIHPDNGEVRIGPYDLQTQRRQAMSLIGAVLEGTRNIYWRLSAWENLMYFARLKGVLARHAAARAKMLLGELGLWDRRKEAVRTYSRGMQQKVAIACALVADPQVVLLDEPTLGLDVQAARTVRKWVAQLSHEQGKTVVLTTHQLPMAQDLCDQIAIMREGKLLANEPTQKLLTLFDEEVYNIRLQGKLPEQAVSDLPGFSANYSDGQTVLTGPVRQGQDLYALLDRFRSAGLPLVSVTRERADLEGIFLKLMDQA
ncbi:MAG: ABC transporter ATP-binding protein [Candidatus Marinimicrobia bacterium]|nr:ABC transporter ATP-binding protein [Candidatus Neomarinimicrobiota bacterium]